MVEVTEGKVSSSINEQEDKVEKNKPGKIATANNTVVIRHYKKEGTVGGPNKENTRQYLEEGKLEVYFTMDKDKNKNRNNPNKRDLSLGSTPTPERNNNNMEAKRELDWAFSGLKEKDVDCYEEYGAIKLNQKDIQDLSSHLSKNPGDETDTETLGLTSHLSEAQANNHLTTT